MAVGCSRDEVDDVIEQSKLTGAAVVACVDWPSSVTLSGDVDTFGQLRVIFDERKVFARRLKFEMAYHSWHMNRVFSSYSAFIADLEPITQDHTDEEGKARTQTMASSVTGQDDTPELLGPYYWVRNLVSPALFSDAVKEFISPADCDSNDGSSDSNNTVDMLIEVGTESTLSKRVEQITTASKM